jgi:hypothetical protein
MGAVYAALDKEQEEELASSPVSSLGISAKAREVLVPSEGSEQHQAVEIINEDGLDCLSNDAVERQYPIHIAYRSSLVMTLTEGEDGIARLITRDLIGDSLPPFSLPLSD